MKGLRWISWRHNGDDYRPVSWPPPPEVLGFWCSGYGWNADESEYACVIALLEVEGEDEDDIAAKSEKIVHDVWNPGVGEWRFNEENAPDKDPSVGGRFGVPEWSVKLGRWPWKVVDE